MAEEPQTSTTELSVKGMTCAACVRHVERAIGKIDGVDEALVSFASEAATISHTSAVEPQAVIDAINSAGYQADFREAVVESSEDDPLKKDRVDILVAILLGLPTFGISMFWHPRPEWANWLLLVLSTPVIAFSGRRFFVTTYKSISHKTVGMDTLIALGTSAAWLYSTWALFKFSGDGHAQSNNVYYETAAVIVLLILVGKHLEARSRRRMSDSIRSLMALAPDTAILIRPGGKEDVVPLERIAPKDQIRVRPGDRIPADGTVADGESYIDESMLTGEPDPVLRAVGDSVTGGTIVQNGTLVVRIDRVGKETTLSRIIQMVERAQTSKAPVQKLVDKVAGIFVPAVIVTAALTFGGWLMAGGSVSDGLTAAVAVLIIACPCALGLATPAAIVVSSGRGAELGVLIKDSESLERAGAVDTILLDKTGTLTEGRPALVEFRAISGDKADLMKWAAAAEHGSEHPVAKAIVQVAGEGPVPEATEFNAVRGKGIEAIVEGRKIVIGSTRWAEELGADVPADSAELAGAGQTVMVMLVDGETAALIGVADPIRETSRSAIQEMKDQGLRTVMVTGDSRSTALAVAQQLGLDQVEAEVLPEGKAEIVAKHQKTGTTAMVGDGINDAPALAQADLGIAMGSGTDQAMETAGVTLMRPDLRGAITAIRLSKRTIATIKMNLFWAFGYNVVMIPLAAFGKLSPMWAAGAMAFSSVSVILNSLRLKRFE